MTEKHTPEDRGGVRGFVARWKRTALIVGAVAFSEIGRRIGVLGIDERILGDFIRRGGSNNGMLGLYDLIVGGALSRGAILGLGVMPYISARLWMRVGRAVSPKLREMWTRDEGRTRMQRWTRRLTFVLSTIQSYGYARIVQSVPGAVANPGIGFTIRTMVVFTAATMVATLIGEQIMPYGEVDVSEPGEAADVDEVEPRTAEEGPIVIAATYETPELLLGAGAAEPVRVDQAERQGEAIRRDRM